MSFRRAQSPSAPFIYVFQQIGWVEVKWVVTVGAIFALCTNLLGAMFPLPRVLYAMASDGIIYKRLKSINVRTKTPLLATIVSGILSAIMALIFDLHQLIDMMSIGTLVAYTIVSICVLVLRYQCDDPAVQSTASRRDIIEQLFNIRPLKETTTLSANIAKFGIIAYSLGAIVFCVLLKQLEMNSTSVTLMVFLGLVGVVLVLLMTIIARQPSLDDVLTFKVPFVPWVPCLSVLINLYLMFQLDIQTWIRMAVWAIVGKIVTFVF